MNGRMWLAQKNDGANGCDWHLKQVMSWEIIDAAEVYFISASEGERRLSHSFPVLFFLLLADGNVQMVEVHVSCRRAVLLWCTVVYYCIDCIGANWVGCLSLIKGPSCHPLRNSRTSSVGWNLKWHHNANRLSISRHNLITFKVNASKVGRR